MKRKISIAAMRWKLFLFGLFKIRLIGYCRPQLLEVTEEHIKIRIRLNRRTRNHVGSLYLGVMSIGADLASGFLAFYLLEMMGLKAAPVFGSMKAEYLKRAEGDVIFICSEGPAIQKMIDASVQTGERSTQSVRISAMCLGEEVATFDMGLSFKVKTS